MADLINEFGGKVSIDVWRTGQTEFWPGTWAQGVTICFDCPSTRASFDRRLTEQEARALLRELQAAL